jgi:hypothetical protein
LMFFAGAVFHGLWTINHGDQFFGSFADSALIRPARGVIRRRIIPRAKIITGILIVVQLLIAFSIFSRGPLAGIGLIAGAVFSFGAAIASNAPGMIANLSMAAVLGWLASAR